MLRMVSLPSSSKEKAKLVIDDLATAVVRILMKHKQLELRCASGVGEGTFGEVQIVDHFVIERLAAWHAVARKNDIVRKSAVLPKCLTPSVEPPLAQKRMRAVIDKI